MKRILLGLAAVTCGTLAALVAQGGPEPTCTMCPATSIGNDEIQAYVKKAIAERLTDSR